MWSLRARLGPQPPDKCFTGSAWVWCVSRAARDTGQRRPRVSAQGRGGGGRKRGSNAQARLRLGTPKGGWALCLCQRPFGA